MDWITGIQNAINYIEDHLTEELDYEDFDEELRRKAVTEWLPASGYVLRAAPESSGAFLYIQILRPGGPFAIVSDLSLERMP